ncbi:galactofuranose ABC transporter, permease protein YjfF [Stigmatella aurantiaca]|uniref:Monosaccharide-transporting ATPase n=1 Tax=Stigmatella aurantiaca (strain DW4/3-1) TaxID=378806 RepID=Q08PR1_STIAD|nr:galactofuranose ABC transporter, permease protein YjfF [Stigmatella aurantiaca]ADO69720.1 Monosaccharide-transporting ATPase [Stigmatella aurantiaca DW4/3-1]EAU62469.1 putative sugar uptake ABC transporter permease protein [Stigmatella aurantiaca DW4/3-1]
MNHVKAAPAAELPLLIPPRPKLRLDPRYLPLTVTLGLFVAMFGAGSFAFDGFFSLQVFLNLFIDNSFLVVTAIGMTFVIISGGIDLSVGSVIALTTMVLAALVENQGWSPALAVPLVLVMGAVIGSIQGFVIHYFAIQPFIVTLAGMFLARGLCYLISINSIAITHTFFTEVSALRFPLPFDSSISINVVIALAVLAGAIYLAHYTRFGRTIYAMGGNEQSALLMGLPVARTKILTYTFSGLCSALAGVSFTFYMLSGYGLHAQGMEMDAIAAAVIGGTLLTGGSGYVAGTLVGVLIYGTIQTLIMFEGSLSSWWTKIVIGLLLLVFCLFQKVFEKITHRRGQARAG